MFGTHPLVRFLNQNRRQIRITIIVIILIFIVIQVLNRMAEDNMKKNNEIQNSYNVSTNVGENVLNKFLNYCKEGNESNAYALLSLNAKKTYTTKEVLRTDFIKKYFTKDKTFTITKISGDDANSEYYVKISDDVLASGKYTGNQNSITIGVFVVKENNEYKIKIN